MNAPRKVLACAVRKQARHRPGEAHPPLVQQHDAVVGGDLVDQVRRPQHADAVFPNEPAHDGKHALARGDIEADGRLVEQQAGRIVQQRAGDLDAPRLAARQGAHLLAGTAGEARPD